MELPYFSEECISPIPPGNQALAQALFRAETPRLVEPRSRSPSNRPSLPLAFLAKLLSETCDNLRLSPRLVQDLSPETLQTITAGEGSILTLLCATVLGIVAIASQLDTVTTQLAELQRE